MEDLGNAKKSFDISLGQMIHDLRILSGYTQAELGEMIGVTRSAFSYYESGKSNPGLYTLRKLAVVFGIEAGDFFYPEKFDPQKTGRQRVSKRASQRDAGPKTRSRAKDTPY